MAKIIEQFKFYLKNYWWKFLIIAVVVAIDLVSKALIVKVDGSGNVISNETTLIDGVLVILPVLNEGAGFSILSGKTIFLIVVTIMFLCGLVVFDFFYKKKSVLFAVSTGLIFAGAVGNLIDRFVFGKVRDFIYLKFINFPVFNVADISLTAGIICLLVYLIFYSNKKKETTSQKIKAETIQAVDCNDTEKEFEAEKVPDTISQQKENDDAKDNS